MQSGFIIVFLLIVLKGHGQDIFHPRDLDSMAAAAGDLDHDGIAERAIVYNSHDTTDDGTTRELRIFKLVNNKWTVWIKSRNAILKSEEGGMMGDPFAEIEIKNGVLNISFEGGSSWKWNYTDRYRYQHNTFQLIGHKSYAGKLCEYWESFDYNISTGKIVYKKEYENCDDNQKITKTENEVFVNKMEPVNIQHRYPSNIRIKTPKLKRDLFL